MAKASGKFVLRLEPDLHERLRMHAAMEGISLNEFCRGLLLLGLSPSSDRGSEALARAVREAERRFGGDLVGVVLFGSLSRGEAHDESDVDLAVVLESARPLRRELYRGWPDFLERDRVEMQFVHLPEPPEAAGSLWLECAMDGTVLSDPSGRIRRILKRLKTRIASGRVIRRTTHGQGYWVHP